MEIIGMSRNGYKLEFDRNLGGCYTQISHDGYNCKLSFIHVLDNIIDCGNTERAKERMDLVLKQCMIIVAANTYKKELVDFIKKNYELYSCSEVPVGYAGTEIQYHMIIRNTLSQASNIHYLRKALPDEKEEALKEVNCKLQEVRRLVNECFHTNERFKYLKLIGLIAEVLGIKPPRSKSIRRVRGPRKITA